MVDVSPGNVHATLAKHLLADGMDLVFDMKRSQGSYIVDARNERRFLDFFSFFVTYPVGINHPRVVDPAFKEKLGEVAIQNPSNSDVYTVEMAEFVDTYSRVAIPEHLPYLFAHRAGSSGRGRQSFPEGVLSRDPGLGGRERVPVHRR